MLNLIELFEELGKEELTSEDFIAIRMADAPDSGAEEGMDAWRVGILDHRGEAYAKTVYAPLELKDELRRVWLQGDEFSRKLVRNDQVVEIQ